MKDGRVVVVGAGLGGLAAACLLAARGVPTTLVEKNAEVGGCASGIRRDGFCFDIGATMLEVPSVTTDFFELLGRRAEDYLHLTSLDPVYTLRFADGSRLELSRSVEATADAVGALSPGDRAAFLRYIAETDQLKRDLKTLFVTSGFARAADLVSRAGRNVFRTLNPLSTVQRRIDSLFEDPRLREAFSFQVMYFGISPRDCPAIYAMVPYFEITKGILHARGGLFSLARALAEIFGELGGELRTSSPVREILATGGRVQGVLLESGERLSCAAVVSNADAVYTYSRLLPGVRLPARFRRRLRRYHLSCSTHLILLGLRGRRDDLTHHTFFLPADCGRSYRAIFEEESLPADLAVYLCCPTRTDPTMAPEGCESLYILTPVPRRLAAGSWEDARERLTEQVLDQLEAAGVAGLREQIVSRTVLAPPDYESMFNLPEGMTFGIQPRLGQMGPFRPRVRSSQVAGLFLAGASVYPGAGVPLVISSGRMAAEAVLQDLDGP